MSNWQYNNKDIEDSDIPANALGFLYKITNLESGEWYIGRKMLYMTGYKTKDGKKTKIKKSSDWKTYWSSNDFIKADAKENPEQFKREILLFVTTKASLTYCEEAALYMTGALFDPLCLNSNIRAKIFKNWFNKVPELHQDLVKALA